MERTKFQLEKLPVIVAAVCDLAVIKVWGKHVPLPLLQGCCRGGSVGALGWSFPAPCVGLSSDKGACRGTVPASFPWLCASLLALAVSWGQQDLGSGQLGQRGVCMPWGHPHTAKSPSESSSGAAVGLSIACFVVGLGRAPAWSGDRHRAGKSCSPRVSLDVGMLCPLLPSSFFDPSNLERKQELDFCCVLGGGTHPLPHPNVAQVSVPARATKSGPAASLMLLPGAAPLPGQRCPRAWTWL